MDNTIGTLASIKQQDMLREAASRNRYRNPEKELAASRQRERKTGFRRLLHR